MLHAIPEIRGGITRRKKVAMRPYYASNSLIGSVVFCILLSADAAAQPAFGGGATYSSTMAAETHAYVSTAAAPSPEAPRAVPEMGENEGSNTALPVRNADVVLAANRALALMNEDLKACGQEVPPHPA